MNSSLRALTNLGDGVPELIDVDGLDEVDVETSLEREAAILSLAVAGQGDYHGVGRGGVEAEPASELVAVESGKADIEKAIPEGPVAR